MGRRAWKLKDDDVEEMRQLYGVKNSKGRSSEGVTYKELAEAYNISLDYVTLIIRGDRCKDSVKQLSYDDVCLIRKLYGDKEKYERSKHGLTNKEIAVKFEVTENYIMRITSGLRRKNK